MLFLKDFGGRIVMSKKQIIIICIGLIILATMMIHSYVSDANAWTPPRQMDEPVIVFDRSDNTVFLRVFRFYDTQFRMLCYANGTSMHCTSFSQLTPMAKKELKTEIERIKKSHNWAARIIKLP
jgi:hypothetical protein